MKDWAYMWGAKVRAYVCQIYNMNSNLTYTATSYCTYNTLGKAQK